MIDSYHRLIRRIQFKLHPELRLEPADPPFELLFSRKKKFVYCLICKNACSSILTSILYNDYGREQTEDETVWHNPDIYMDCINDMNLFFENEEDVDVSMFAGFTIFIVLRNPFDKIISFINHTYKTKDFYNYLFDYSLSQEEYVDSVLRMYPYMIDYTRKDHRYDKHAIPQRIYYEKYKNLFGDDLQLVFIEELPSFYENILGGRYILNNVTKAQEKICTKDSLTVGQKELIDTYINKYEFNKNDEYTSIWRNLNDN